MSPRRATDGGPLLYTSTDVVFDGTRGYYRELDPPSPPNYYGLTKSLAEKLVAEIVPGAIVRAVIAGAGDEPRGGRQLLSGKGRGEPCGPATRSSRRRMSIAIRSTSADAVRFYLLRVDVERGGELESFMPARATRYRGSICAGGIVRDVGADRAVDRAADRRPCRGVPLRGGGTIFWRRIGTGVRYVLPDAVCPTYGPREAGCETALAAEGQCHSRSMSCFFAPARNRPFDEGATVLV